MQHPAEEPLPVEEPIISFRDVKLAFERPILQGVSFDLAPGTTKIVLGGSGNGEAIAANRFHGVRCALCWNVEAARLGRQHNDANMLSLGQRMIDEPTALAIVETWLSTPFEGGRHERRIQKIDAE